jgi:hypothetical protein
MLTDKDVPKAAGCRPSWGKPLDCGNRLLPHSQKRLAELRLGWGNGAHLCPKVNSVPMSMPSLVSLPSFYLNSRLPRALSITSAELLPGPCDLGSPDPLFPFPRQPRALSHSQPHPGSPLPIRPNPNSWLFCPGCSFCLPGTLLNISGSS